jgi:hypothetical protein
MAFSRYNSSSYSTESVQEIRNSILGLEAVDFVKEPDFDCQFANHFDSIPLKILTSFIYGIELMAAMIMFSFVSYERSGAAGYYRTVINQLVAYVYGGVSCSIDFLNRFSRTHNDFLRAPYP